MYISRENAVNYSILAARTENNKKTKSNLDPFCLAWILSSSQVTSQHLRRGGVALRASPQQDAPTSSCIFGRLHHARTATRRLGAFARLGCGGCWQEWLAKSREEVEGFSKAQVSSWVAAVLLNAGLEADDITEVTTILLKQKVVGAALLKLTLEKLIPHGPAMLLTRKIRLLQEPQARLVNRLLLTVVLRRAVGRFV